MALDLGANDLIPADFDDAELAIRLRTQVKRKQEADSLRAALDEDLRLAVIDPLTGLYNRRYAMAHLKRLTTRAAETGRNFTIMVADLDRFKQVNDTFGHAAGDAVLVEVARRLKDNLRGNDLVARIGGEEFLIALPDCQLSEARQAGERIRRIIDREPVTLPSRRGDPRHHEHRRRRRRQRARHRRGLVADRQRRPRPLRRQGRGPEPGDARPLGGLNPPSRLRGVHACTSGQPSDPA